MKILVVEDHPLLGKSIKRGLEDAGFVVDLCADGDEGLYNLEVSQYAVVLLDWMLPGVSGLELVKTMRKKELYTPVIMITAKGTTNDRITGYENGADDYIAKPFEMKELIVRVNAMLRRSIAKGAHQLSIGNLTLDLATHCVFVDNEKIDLTSKEFDILALLAGKKGNLVKRQTFVEMLYHLNQEPESNSLDVLMARVRRKVSKSQIEISTVRGKGFLLSLSQLEKAKN